MNQSATICIDFNKWTLENLIFLNADTATVKVPASCHQTVLSNVSVGVVQVQWSFVGPLREEHFSWLRWHRRSGVADIYCI